MNRHTGRYCIMSFCYKTEEIKSKIIIDISIMIVSFVLHPITLSRYADKRIVNNIMIVNIERKNMKLELT